MGGAAVVSYVSVTNLFKYYGRRPILERVNFEADEGEFISIVGASGCGKSTFLRMLLAQETPSKGIISIGGEAPAREPERSRGVVFQKYSVFPHLTVRANIVAAECFGMTRFGRLWGAERRAAFDRADKTLDRLGLVHVADNYPAALSGGMQQRLAIGQAMTAQPKVLLLDEPFGALDPGTRLSMHEFLTELRQETQMTVFMVTHDLEEGFKLGDRVIVFDKPRWDAHEPEAYGATITYDFDARNGGIPFQNLKEDTHVLTAT
jgi:NitT/TauT family transport system ATP-binding protein